MKKYKTCIIANLIILILLILISSSFASNKIITLESENSLKIKVGRLLDAESYLKEIDIQKNIIFKRTGEQDLKLDIYSPASNKNINHPVLIYIHGGGFVIGDKKEILEFKPLLQKLIKNGWLVISINYRLINKKNLFPDNIEDVKDAIRWVRKNAAEYSIDTNKIGLIGHSAGGALALLGGLTDSHIFYGSDELKEFSSDVAFVVSLSGPTKLYDIKDFEVELERTLISYFTKENIQESLLKRASPLEYLHSSSPPILLVHGTEDILVPYQQARLFFDMAVNMNLNCNLIKIDGGGHTVRLTYLPLMEELSDLIIKFIDMKIDS